MSREMKDSEVEWIGEIPSNWEVISINNTTNGEGGILSDGDWIESKDISENGIRYLTTGNIGRGYFKEQGEGYISQETFKELNALAVYPGDLVASRLNLPIGRACILPEKYDQYVIAVDNVLIRTTDNFSKKYLMYSLNTDQFSENGELLARGTTMKRISGNQFKKMKVPMPSVEEQNKIASFLDVKTSEIDTIVEKTRKSIEELKAYKQSLITETVTKGLNPDAPMKESGIEWIGEIPKHWKLTRLSRLFFIEAGGDAKREYYSDFKDDLHPYPVYTNTNIEDKVYAYTSKPLYPEDSITVSGRGAIGKAFYRETPFDAIIRLIVLISKLDLDTRYFTYFISEVIQFNTGSSAVNQLSTIQIAPYKVALPPLKEQEKIATFLDEKTKKIDVLITKKEKMIHELESYKQSLIYEYVTGKKEVE